MTDGYNVLLSVYACEPNKGSEPGIGWNTVCEMAKHFKVWAITRANNRIIIEQELNKYPITNLTFIYYDLPQWICLLKERRIIGVNLYYYLWQIGIFFVIQRLQQKIHFDLINHVTFGVYYRPSFLALLSGKFVLGPVGGGETAPCSFWSSYNLTAIIYEIARLVFRWFGEHDPFVRFMVSHSDLIFATTSESASRLKKLGAANVEILSQVTLKNNEIETLSLTKPPDDHYFRFISIGRLLHWKGFHLGIEAFAKSGLTEAEYWIVGDGPERKNLQNLASKLGIANRVFFSGSISRNRVLEMIAGSHILVHPSLHDSGGFVCLEAMAAGRPVICLDIGGPGLLVNSNSGIKIPGKNPGQTIEQMAKAMNDIAINPVSYERLRQGAFERAKENFTSSVTIYHLVQKYKGVL